ncbi:MAG: hypothetical protein JWM69_368 [Candidatus Binatus sp.]|nr:hypothetical protein [Candidatus Binatus sp.]
MARLTPGRIRSLRAGDARAFFFAALLTTVAASISGCAGLNSAPPPATTSVETLEYYPFQVKGYQGSYPHRSILILMPSEDRDKSIAGTGPDAILDGNPAIGTVLDKNGGTAVRLYSQPVSVIIQRALARSAEEAGMSAHASTETAYRRGVKLPEEYVLATRIKKCWVKKTQGADGHFGAVWRTAAEVAIEVEIYKAPFSVPFWQGSTSETYYDPPLGSFGMSSEDEAGIYDQPGQVLSVALTRAVAGIFRRQDLRNLMLEDDIHAR